MLAPQFNQMKKHLVYWLAPAAVMLIYIFVYFFDIFGLSYLMAPAFNREFGIIENTQALTIVAIGFVCLKGFNYWEKLVKFFFRIGLFTSVFIFLEEIDYGLHYYDWFIGKPTEVIVEEYKSGVRNLHNSFGLTEVFKKGVYVFLAFICLLAAKPKRFLNFSWFKKFQSVIPNRFRPDSYLALTVLLIPLISQLAFFIKRNLEVKSEVLKWNTSEFEETLIYYAIFLYVYQVLKKNSPEGSEQKNLPKRRVWQSVLARLNLLFKPTDALNKSFEGEGMLFRETKSSRYLKGSVIQLKLSIFKALLFCCFWL